MNILWLATAEGDLDALIDYIAQDNPQNALQIFHITRLSVEKLKIYPSLGREGQVEQTRELIIPHLPFIVVYTIKKQIQILAILHTSRKWPDEFSS